MPDDVVDVFGFALHLAQMGKKHDQAKPLKGFGGASVLEVVEDHMGDTHQIHQRDRNAKARDGFDPRTFEGCAGAC